VATGKFSLIESNCLAGELGADEASLSTGKRGSTEADLVAAEVSVSKAPAIEYCASEVEIQVLPGRFCFFSQMLCDYSDDGVTHFTAGAEGEPVTNRSTLAGVRLIGHTQIGAQHVNTCLPILFPVVR
jgi:hypothetical protein